MKLNNIRDVLAVAKAGSIRAASRELGITQPSMTRSIRDTENELGLPLFTRHAHGVTLTDMGRLFVRRGTAIQSELRHIFEEIDQSQGKYIGEVSVAMSAAASIALMPTILNDFQKRYPQATLKFTESLFHPIEADIFSGEIDFFVGPLYEKANTTSLLVEKLFDNKRIVIARKGHPLASATKLEELSGAHWIRPSFSHLHDEADFDAMFARAGLPSPEIILQCRSAMMTLLAVANSNLLTVLPIQWLDFMLAVEQIVPIDLHEALPAAPVCIVHRGDLPLTPLAERFCDLTRKAGLNYSRRLAEHDRENQPG